MGQEQSSFMVVDFETANPDLASICQVGIAGFEDGALRFSFESLVNPEDYFDGINVSIHGITIDMVRTSPRWSDLYGPIAARLCNAIVVSHTAFDRVAMHRACERYQLPEVHCTWLDSASVVRHTWENFARSGYGLSNVAAELGIRYRAHNAFEDARCAGEILIRAVAASGVTIDQWLKHAHRPIHPTCSLPRHESNPNGHLFGEILVFTGSLAVSRPQAALIAIEAGCTVDDGVTKQTTILVVGDQDIRKLAGYEKSSKHRKAEKLIQKGQKLRILTETDFSRVVTVGFNAGANITPATASLPV